MIEKLQMSFRFFGKACKCKKEKRNAAKHSRKCLNVGSMEQYAYARNDMLRNERRCEIYKKIGRLVLTN